MHCLRRTDGNGQSRQRRGHHSRGGRGNGDADQREHRPRDDVRPQRREQRRQLHLQRHLQDLYTARRPQSAEHDGCGPRHPVRQAHRPRTARRHGEQPLRRHDRPRAEGSPLLQGSPRGEQGRNAQRDGQHQAWHQHQGVHACEEHDGPYHRQRSGERRHTRRTVLQDERRHHQHPRCEGRRHPGRGNRRRRRG